MLRRRIAPVVAFCSLMASNAVAQTATPDKKVCIAAAERGQELRDAKKMRDALAQFMLCARKECPTAVAGECSRWAAEAEAALASLKLEAFDDRGQKITAVRVGIDGAAWSDEIPPGPVFLDPGSHEIRFDRAGSETVIRTVSLAMGERDHVVTASFKWTDSPASSASGAAPSTTTTTPASKPETAPKHDASTRNEGGSLVLPIALGGIGVVALGTATTFWLLGSSDLDAARERCANGCADPSADDAKQKHVVGDIALAVGIVAIGAAVYFVLTREKAPQPVLRF